MNNRWISSFTAGTSTGKIAIGLSAIAAVGLGALFLITFPLQTVIVLLLGASLFVLDRS
jgi:hypothetical protein